MSRSDIIALRFANATSLVTINYSSDLFNIAHFLAPGTSCNAGKGLCDSAGACNYVAEDSFRDALSDLIDEYIVQYW